MVAAIPDIGDLWHPGGLGGLFNESYKTNQIECIGWQAKHKKWVTQNDKCHQKYIYP